MGMQDSMVKRGEIKTELNIVCKRLGVQAVEKDNKEFFSAANREKFEERRNFTFLRGSLFSFSYPSGFRNYL